MIYQNYVNKTLLSYDDEYFLKHYDINSKRLYTEVHERYNIPKQNCLNNYIIDINFHGEIIKGEHYDNIMTKLNLQKILR
jgi:hypothetical protein